MDNYISVSEYANLYHKDPGNIRRHLASGRMAGQKIGNQWVVLKDEKYPSDDRLRSGEYCGWRRKVALNSDKELMTTVKAIISDLVNIFGASLDKVVLYGSYARGTQTSDSDVDIALLLNKDPDKRTIEKMVKCVAQHELECGRVLSVIEIQKSKFDVWKSSLPFYMNIDKEGIVLWKAT